MDEYEQDGRPDTGRPDPTRRAFLATAATVGAGLGVAGALAATAAHPATAWANADAHASALAALPRTCQESVQDLLNTTLTAEHLTLTCYYTALTTPALLTQIAGSPSGPAGMAGNVACLQAALNQEMHHAQVLENLGALSPHTAFFVPASAIEHLGYTSHTGTFLWVLDHLETACIGAYLRRIERYAALDRPDLALYAARTLGVEAEHRALYRVIAQDYPANNITLQVAQFTCADDIQRVLRPYVTGQGLPGHTRRTVALPTQAQIEHVLAKMM